MSKRYKPSGLFPSKRAERQALDAVDLTITKGTLTALVGPSGSGKSTLARCLALLEEPDTGQICFEGKTILRLPPSELRAFRARFQYVFQDAEAALNPRLSAADAIAEPLVIQNVGSRQERRGLAKSLIQRVGLDPTVAHRSCHEFSGGQKQRLVIARALALQPSLLIFDESLSGLDPQTRDEILELLLRLRRELGITQMLISHDVELVSSIADTIVVMRDGRIVKPADTEGSDLGRTIGQAERLLNYRIPAFSFSETK